MVLSQLCQGPSKFLGSLLLHRTTLYTFVHVPGTIVVARQVAVRDLKWRRIWLCQNSELFAEALYAVCQASRSNEELILHRCISF